METLHTKNKRTGQHEAIAQHNLESVDWGFCFLVDTELGAFKAAYLYRHNPHGVDVNWAPGAQKWSVTVFNARAKEIGIDGAK